MNRESVRGVDGQSAVQSGASAGRRLPPAVPDAGAAPAPARSPGPVLLRQAGRRQ